MAPEGLKSDPSLDRGASSCQESCKLPGSSVVESLVLMTDLGKNLAPLLVHSGTFLALSVLGCHPCLRL